MSLSLSLGKTQYGSDLERFDGPRIVTVGIVSGDEILCGRRRDNGKWTNPGGHMDAGESPKQAAVREVFEEAGIKIAESDLHLVYSEKLISHRNGKPFVVFGFIAKVSKGSVTAKNDPDNEFSELRWVKIRPESTELRPENRHAQRDCIVEHLLG